MSAAQQVLESYGPLLAHGKSHHPPTGRKIPIPRFGEALLIQLCQEAFVTLKSMSSQRSVDPSAYVVSNIHGNIVDLIRIFGHSDLFIKRKFVFLGGYVEFGSFNIECVTLLLALQCVYPNNIVLLHGETEFEMKCPYFLDEIKGQYGDGTKLVDNIMSVFSYLPFSCVIGNMILCVPAGIGPSIKDLSVLKKIVLPVTSINTKILRELVSSRAIANYSGFSDAPGFGEDAIVSFLQKNKLKKMIRGYECSSGGVMPFANGSVVTVFSCCNFNCGLNKAGFVLISDDLKIKGYSLPPIPPLDRRKALFSAMLDKNASVIPGFVKTFSLPKNYPSRRLTQPAFVPSEPSPEGGVDVPLSPPPYPDNRSRLSPLGSPHEQTFMSMENYFIPK